MELIILNFFRTNNKVFEVWSNLENEENVTTCDTSDKGLLSQLCKELINWKIMKRNNPIIWSIEKRHKNSLKNKNGSDTILKILNIINQ